MARYRATRQGFDGKVVREPGEEFEFSGKKGSWMEEIGGELTKQQIVSKLMALKVEFNGADKKEILAGLLAEAEQKAAEDQ